MVGRKVTKTTDIVYKHVILKCKQLKYDKHNHVSTNTVGSRRNDACWPGHFQCQLAIMNLTSNKRKRNKRLDLVYANYEHLDVKKQIQTRRKVRSRSRSRSRSRRRRRTEKEKYVDKIPGTVSIDEIQKITLQLTSSEGFKSINQSTNQINQINQSINQSVNPSIIYSTLLQ